jgi:glutaredoxin
MSVHIKFYTKVDCPLCEKAHLVLEELKEDLDLKIEIIDIYQSDELIEKYGLMIPVVEADGEEIDYGYISKEFLRERLHSKCQ